MKTSCYGNTPPLHKAIVEIQCLYYFIGYFKALIVIIDVTIHVTGLLIELQCCYGIDIF